MARKITVPLGDDLDRILREASGRDGSSEAAFVREAIAAKAAHGQALSELAAIEARLARLERHLGIE